MDALQPRKPPIHPRVEMRSFFWKRIILPASSSSRSSNDQAANKPDETIWSQIHEVPFDLDEFESLFARKPPSKNKQAVIPGNGSEKTMPLQGNRDQRSRALDQSSVLLEHSGLLNASSSGTGSRRTAADEPALLDPKRAHLIGLLTASLPPIERVKEALLRMDEQALSRRDCDALMKIIPTDEEASRLLQVHPGRALNKTEQYLRELARLRSAPIRLRALIYRQSFEERAEQILAPLETIQTACRSIRSSDALRTILAVMLSLGNYMNGGTSRGQADGFELISALDKLGDTKALDGQMTLLTYVACICGRFFAEERPPNDSRGEQRRAGQRTNTDGECKALSSLEKLQRSCRAAARESLKDVQTEVAGMRTELEALLDSIHLAVNDTKQCPRGSSDAHENSQLAHCMEAFAREAREALHDIQETVRLAVQEYQRTLRFLGYSSAEAQSIQPEEFFGPLSRFLERFRNCLGGRLTRKEAVTGR
jgi:hypothetical protein